MMSSLFPCHTHQWSIKSFKLSLLKLGLSLPLLCASACFAADREPAQTSSPAASAAAESASATEAIRQVEIKAIRDPAIMPYKRAYEMLTGIQRLALDDVKISIRVLAAKTHAVIPDLQIFLEGPSQRQRLSIADSGEISIPLDAQAYAEGAEFIANQKRGSMQVDLQLTPRLAQNAIRYSALNHSADSARKALREIIPWYYRLFISSLNGVAFCYDQPGHAVLLKPDQQTGSSAAEVKTIQADYILKNPPNQTWYCARLRDGEKNDAMVEPEPGWTALYY